MKTITLGSRRYFAHVPRKLPRNPALVVALHAGAQTPEGFERMTGWSAVATRDRFVVAYPEGVERSWNAGNGALGEAGRTGVDDVGFVDAVIRDACARWKCGRAFLSGFSNGSMLAHWYVSQFPAVVSAAGCVSGGFSRLPVYGLSGSPADRIASGIVAPAVRMVHGYQDDHVPFAGGVGPWALDPYDHLPIEQTASWWRGQGAEVVTEWHACGHACGHVWPPGEAVRQWEFFRGVG
jgi:polyhydroxybutyrate depolymerase